MRFHFDCLRRLQQLVITNLALAGLIVGVTESANGQGSNDFTLAVGPRRLFTSDTAIVDFATLANQFVSTETEELRWSREEIIWEVRRLMYLQKLRVDQVGMLLQVLFPVSRQDPDYPKLPALGHVKDVYFDLYGTYGNGLTRDQEIDNALTWYSEHGNPRRTPYVLPDDLLDWYESAVASKEFSEHVTLMDSLNANWDRARSQHELEILLQRQVLFSLMPFVPLDALVDPTPNARWSEVWSICKTSIRPIQPNLRWSTSRSMYVYETGR